MATKASKPVKKPIPKTTKAAPLGKKLQESKKEAGLSASVIGVDGKASSKMVLPTQLFGAKVNQPLLSQAVRVFLANQRAGSAKTKTRGEVEGSTRKIYRQKGTGRARHGSIRAPIFVGGGIVFGPVIRDYHKKLSKSMRRAALVSALTSRREDLVIIDGLESTATKTKQVAAALSAAGITGSVLLIVPKGAVSVIRAARNIDGLDIINAMDLHPYALIAHKRIVFTKQALEESKAHFAH